MILKVDTNTTVVFDLDDTLYNELDFLKSSYQELSQELDSENSNFLYASMFAMYRNKENVFAYLSQHYDISVPVLIEKYRNHIPKIQLFDHVATIMQHIKDYGGKVALITDGRSTTQRNKIKQLGIENFIDFMVISEEIGSEKPSLQNFQLVAEHLKTKNNWYIADNLKKDFVAPNHLGWQSICLIDNGKNIHINKLNYYLSEAERPCFFIQNFREITIFKK
jgi:putative hydrolase of the HAD superfamily